MILTISNWFSANLDTLAFITLVAAVCIYKIVKEWVWFLDMKDE